MTESARVYTGAATDPALSAARARRWGWWYFAEHYVRQLFRYGWVLIISDIGQPLLYFIAMGIGLGTLVDANAGTVEGVAYLTFIAPAMLIATSTQTANGEFTYPVMSGFKWQRFYWGAGSSPLSPRQIAVGHALAACSRLLFQALVVIVLMALFGVPLAPTVFLLFLIGPLSALAFALPVQAYAATLNSEGAEFTFITRFIVVPLFLFSGTFFPLDVLPLAVRWIGWISPVWHGAELARWASYGKEMAGFALAGHVLFLLVLAVGGSLIGGRTYTARLRS